MLTLRVHRFLLVAVITVIGLVYRLATFLPTFRTYLLRGRSRLVAKENIDTISGRCYIGDWFILYLIGMYVLKTTIIVIERQVTCVALASTSKAKLFTHTKQCHFFSLILWTVLKINQYNFIIIHTFLLFIPAAKNMDAFMYRDFIQQLSQHLPDMEKVS